YGFCAKCGKCFLTYRITVCILVSKEGPMSDEAVKEAMAVLRSRRKPESIVEAARLGGAAGKGRPKSEAHKQKLRAARAARRERERAAGLLPGLAAPKKEATVENG